MTEARCLICGCPQSDHINVPLRYVLKAWLLHRPWVWRSHLLLWIRAHA